MKGVKAVKARHGTYLLSAVAIHSLGLLFLGDIRPVRTKLCLATRSFLIVSSSEADGLETGGGAPLRYWTTLKKKKKTRAKPKSERGVGAHVGKDLLRFVGWLSCWHCTLSRRCFDARSVGGWQAGGRLSMQLVY